MADQPLVTPADLGNYIGVAGSVEVSVLTETLASANELVAKYVGQAEVPPPILRSAVLECGSKLYARRFGPDGEYGDATGTPMLAPRDPMITAYPILGPFVGLGL